MQACVHTFLVRLQLFWDDALSDSLLTRVHASNCREPDVARASTACAVRCVESAKSGAPDVQKWFQK
eukprot:741500-Prymnesium_polylepis.1